ncbi:MAG: hypothetical protein HETSPECPRED_001506 [Heterodermia speciosa]|uniref:Uncharacterized protein n=1 Tax=Heterodermia speciosa TaxID=116794 RepID=A0A8H3J1W5_9LECA|nr:MAG: hypothetical protein HETSPECPRED_001506 [Heterodermia speciosa]
MSSIQTAAQAARDATQDAATIALLTGLIGPLTTAEEAAAIAAAAPSVEAAASVAAALASAEAASAALEAATEATETDSCLVSKRWLGPGRRVELSPRATPLPFCLKHTAPINPPSNQDEIPDEQNCVNKIGETATYTKADVLAALEQGARYKLGNQQGTKGKYPHTFGNTAGVDTVITNAACAGQTILEFPILSDGALVNVSKNKQFDVGTERVLFTIDAAGQTLYCGTITHHSPTKVPNPNGGPPLDPFTNC